MSGFALSPEEIVRRLAIDPPIYAGKTVHQMDAEELKKCALHFRDEGMKMHHYMHDLLRRIKALELGLSKETIALIDWWLVNHADNKDGATRGDGRLVYAEWTSFKFVNGRYEYAQK
jgi:hypothetical protein